jgi:hypothetical protein
MKQSIVFIILVLGIFGCQDVTQPEKPKNLIAKDKMIDILMETYLDNAARSIDNKTIISKGIKMDSMVYKKFGIDSLQFAKSNAYYAADVNIYMEMFKEVETRLTKMQQKMDSIWEKEWVRNDSIKQELKDRKANAELVKDSLI